MRARLFEPRIVGGGTGARQQLGDHSLVHVAVLPQVEHREVEAEHVDGTPQRVEPTRGERRRAVGCERRGDGVEIGTKAPLASRTVIRSHSVAVAARTPTRRGPSPQGARRRRRAHCDRVRRRGADSRRAPALRARARPASAGSAAMTATIRRPAGALRPGSARTPAPTARESRTPACRRRRTGCRRDRRRSTNRCAGTEGAPSRRSRSHA